MLTIPPTAPFEGPQKMWLKGYLDALSTAFPRSSATLPPQSSLPATARGIRLTITWGSQTGSSESLARKLAKTLSNRGHHPSVRDLAELSPGDLPALSPLLIITSTYGDGEPPDNAAPLHAALHAADAPAMHDLSFSVLALGDSSYPDFCKCGHDFDQRLSALGAKRITPLVECDVGDDHAFTRWGSLLDDALTLV